METTNRYQAKLQFVAARQQGTPWKDAAEQAHLEISRDTAYRLVRWAQEEGEERLREGRHGHPSKLREEVARWLEKAYQQAPRTPGHQMQARVLTQFDLVVSVSHLNQFRSTLRKTGRLGEKGTG